MRIFFEMPLSDYLEDRRASVTRQISDLKPELLLSSDLNKYSARILSEFSEADFIVHFDRRSVTVVTRDVPGWMFPKTFQHSFVSHTKTYRRRVISIGIPFEGNAKILECTPQEYKPWTTDVQISDHAIQFELVDFDNNDEKVKREIERTLRIMETQYSFVRRQLASFDEQLGLHVSKELDRRIAEVQSQEGLLQALGIRHVGISDGIHVKDSVVVEKYSQRASSSFEFDVAISYASEDLNEASSLLGEFEKRGIRVFFAPQHQAELWGKDMGKNFRDAFGGSTRFVLILVSEHYAVKDWTDFEFTIARAEAGMREVEFILPVRLDSTPLFGLKSTVSYLEYHKDGPSKIADLLKAKLSSDT